MGCIPAISRKLGIHLTQVTPTSSVSERGGLPSNARGVRGPIRHRRSLSGLSREAALADGVYLSTLRAHPRLARAHGVVAVREPRSPNFGHGGHHLRRHARPPDDVVPGDVVRDQSEDRDQRPELAAGLGPAELSDRLGVAAHAAPGHGAPRAGSARRAAPAVHRVVSLLKRWLLGTHHGGVSRAHLDAYLDEFTFCFNRRRSRHRGKLFFRLVQQAVTLEPVPYEQLIQRGRRR